ncbi:hypothetical protein SAMN06295981_2285 [Corynebacterium pollutisoli]|uniref:Uncharacterized protein n=1 Tax=Corynebacterium pollutisoli TaxID=1610489 RepID=A0A1X7K8U3_9CORY|nr:hypothetical protein [Corynebacterium pollutisoli]SMG36758.1 hypothetical protein SAMN06295981_2285 [Corynebacterium pollutisoli]
MTRSERNNLLAILAAIILIIGGIAAAVIFGVKDAEPQLVADEVAVTDGATQTPSAEPAPPADPLADAQVNSIHSGGAPEVGDTFGDVARMRSWEGEVDVWRGGNPQIILGPAGNWFPAGQPGCGDGRYVVEFSATGQLTASLRDELGETTREKDARTGWMLLDDCHLPYVTLTGEAEDPQDTVVFEVHEFQPAG